LRFGFEELRLEGIHARDFSQNQASGKAKVRNVLHFRRDVKKWSQFEDIEIYSTLKAEFHYS
jgi:hypothetical protein